ncbi:hypothetical protein C7271_11980 [filamentous cyanobacterium CCP5]|nr:hypothetical protein C7271_11980 [filamentous cyanobacterium CCP5]
MTTGGDRLDRIEALLEQTAQQQRANAEAIDQMRERQIEADENLRASIADVVQTPLAATDGNHQ